jgi:hypothetical protein
VKKERRTNLAFVLATNIFERINDAFRKQNSDWRIVDDSSKTVCSSRIPTPCGCEKKANITPCARIGFSYHEGRHLEDTV